MFQAMREDTEAESALHQGRLRTLNKKRSSGAESVEDKIDKEGWKIKD